MRGRSNIKGTRLLFIIFSVVFLTVLIIFPAYYHHQLANAPNHSSQNNQLHHPPQHSPRKQPPKKPPENKPSKTQTYWGVDTSSQVTEAFYQCIQNNYGKPDVVGRYLGTNSGTSTGLRKEEISILKKKGAKIIPIYNHFSNATGYKNGVLEAQSAISLAKELAIPKGVVIYADIEPKYPVDAEFIRGWVETISSSPYKPGIYGVFLNGKQLSDAYNQAISKNMDLKNETYIWTSNPEAGTTKKQNAPEYKPNTPNFINAVIWQYGMQGQQCNVDTDLIQSSAFSGGF